MPLFDSLSSLSQNEKFFHDRPEIGLWMWFLLYTHARGQASRVPERVTLSMTRDAESFLVRAIKIKPALKHRLLKILSIHDLRTLARYLPAAAGCDEILEAFIQVSRTWTEWKCDAVALHPANCFARLCSFAAVTKLKLRSSTGLDEQALLVMLRSDIRSSLKSLSLPSSLSSYSCLLQLTEGFPVLERLGARRTMLRGDEAGYLVRLCPALTKLVNTFKKRMCLIFLFPVSGSKSNVCCSCGSCWLDSQDSRKTRSGLSAARMAALDFARTARE